MSCISFLELQILNVETGPGSPAFFVLRLSSVFSEHLDLDLLAKLPPGSFEPCEIRNFRQVLKKMEFDSPELDLE